MSCGVELSSKLRDYQAILVGEMFKSRTHSPRGGSLLYSWACWLLRYLSDSDEEGLLPLDITVFKSRVRCCVIIGSCGTENFDNFRPDSRNKKVFDCSPVVVLRRKLFSILFEAKVTHK